jgi:glycosyltransferase involved in cell wall biosynthesis
VIPVGIAAASLPAEAEVCQARAQRAGNGPLRLITVGRFIPCRAHADLADVARQLAAQGLDFRWILVGDGTEVARFEDRAQSLGVRDRFELTGSLPFAAVQELLIAADIMVLNAVIAPSGEREALGVSLIEGSALGLPVVSCRVGGIPEIVTDGETGFLVAAGDATALAERILQLARDPDLRLQLGAAAMARARQRFSSERLAAQLEAFYDRVRGLRASA